MLVLPRGPRPGDQFNLTITEIRSTGLGYAAVPAIIGPQRMERTYKTFVRKGVPGDQLTVEVESCRKGEINARIVEILVPSPDRITPKCKHFGSRHEPNSGCGGCSYQNLSLETQRHVKQETVRKYFASVGLASIPIEPTLATPNPWFYRNKMEFSFGPSTAGEFALGMHPNGYRYDVIRQEECFLMSEFVAEFVPRISDWALSRKLPYESRAGGWLKTLVIREGKRTGQRMVELVTTYDTEIAGFSDAPEVVARQFADAAREIAHNLGGNIDSIYWTQHRALRGEPTRLIEHHLCGAPLLVEELRLPGNITLQFDIHPRAFFQPNTLGAEMIYGEIMRQSDIFQHPARRILDLYCGTGTIALALSHCADEVVGVELQPDAVRNAQMNAARNHITNATFLCGDVGEVLKSHDLTADLIVVDPPRAGLLPLAHEQIARIPSERLVYVSCKPESLARDTKKLLDTGWKIERVQPIDSFPQTYHIETVASFSRSR